MVRRQMTKLRNSTLKLLNQQICWREHIAGSQRSKVALGAFCDHASEWHAQLIFQWVIHSAYPESNFFVSKLGFQITANRSTYSGLTTRESHSVYLSQDDSQDWHSLRKSLVSCLQQTIYYIVHVHSRAVFPGTLPCLIVRKSVTKYTRCHLTTALELVIPDTVRTTKSVCNCTVIQSVTNRKAACI